MALYQVVVMFERKILVTISSSNKVLLATLPQRRRGPSKLREKLEFLYYGVMRGIASVYRAAITVLYVS